MKKKPHIDRSNQNLCWNTLSFPQGTPLFSRPSYRCFCFIDTLVVTQIDWTQLEKAHKCLCVMFQLDVQHQRQSQADEVCRVV